MSLFDNSNLVFAIFAILLFLVLVIVYMMFGPLPNQSKFLSDNVSENITIRGLMDVQTSDKINSIAIGLNAGNKLTGIQNVMIGSSSGKNITTGIENTFVGYGTGEMLIDGTNNTFVGNEAGFYTTGSDNTFVGSNAGNLNSSGTNNTYVGSGAGENTNGSNNIFLGYNAGNATGNVVTSGNNLFYVNANISSSSDHTDSLPAGLPSGFKLLAYNPTTGQIVPVEP